MSLHSFDPEIAQRVGVNAAVIYQNLLFWTEKNHANNKHVMDGHVWTYNSTAAFSELFPYLSPSQVKTALAKLIESGLVLKGEYNQNRYDRTNWYSPAVTAKWSRCAIGEKSPMDCAEISNQSEKNRQPIPDSKPDNKPDRASQPKMDLPKRFEEAWSAYPSGQGKGCGKPEGARSYLSQLREGATEADLVAAIKAYAKQTEAEYALRFDRFLRNEVWREHVPASPESMDAIWRVRLAAWQQRGTWSEAWGPDPDSAGCKAPAQLIARAKAEDAA